MALITVRLNAAGRAREKSPRSLKQPLQADVLLHGVASMTRHRGSFLRIQGFTMDLYPPLSPTPLRISLQLCLNASFFPSVAQAADREVILYTKKHLLFKAAIPPSPDTTFHWKSGGQSRSDPKAVGKTFLDFQRTWIRVFPGKHALCCSPPKAGCVTDAPVT